MKLYSLTGASAVVDEDYGSFDVAEDNSVDVPDELARKLHIVHIAGKKMWEDEAERHARLVAEELARRKDPASLFDAVQELTRQMAEKSSGSDKPAAKKTASRRSSSDS